MKTLFSSVALFFLAIGASAQGVPDGSTWRFASDGDEAHVQVTDNGQPTQGVDVTVIDNTGFTGAMPGYRGVDSTPAHPTCSTSNTGTTGGGTQYRVKKDRHGKSYLERTKPGGKPEKGLRSQRRGQKLPSKR